MPDKRTPDKRTPDKRTPDKRTPDKRTPSKRTPAKRTPGRKEKKSTPKAAATTKPKTVWKHGVLDNNTWDDFKTSHHMITVEYMALVTLDDPKYEMPVDEALETFGNCDFIVKFIDSLYLPTNTETDTARLRLVLVRPDLLVKKFYGHLGKEGIALLPKTIKELCLAIGCRADAEAISALEPWNDLKELLVSVGPDVALEDLRPLPLVFQRGILFIALTDERVPMVVPAIWTLAKRKSLTGLYFPKAQLTAAGAIRLAQALRDMESLEVKYTIIIEPKGLWRPDATEKEEIKAMLKKRMIIPDVQWSMAYIYY